MLGGLRRALEHLKRAKKSFGGLEKKLGTPKTWIRWQKKRPEKMSEEDERCLNIDDIPQSKQNNELSKVRASLTMYRVVQKNKSS